MATESRLYPSSQSRLERYLQLDQSIVDNPYRQELFDEIVTLAQQEEQDPVSREGSYGQLILTEMVEMAGKMRDTSRLEDQYRLLAQHTSTGELWYDLVLGLTNRNDAEFLSRHMSGRIWRRALDIGCGPGILTELLKDSCLEVVGIDKLRFLMNAGREYHDLAGTTLIAGDAAHTPFAKRSFDLIVTNGVTGYLTVHDLRRMTQEVGRLLAPSGSYVEVYRVRNPEGTVHPDSRHFMTNAKGILASLIGELITHRVSEKEEGESPLEVMREEFKDFGLTDVSFTDYASGLTLFRFARGIGMDELIAMSI